MQLATDAMAMRTTKGELFREVPRRPKEAEIKDYPDAATGVPQILSILIGKVTEDRWLQVRKPMESLEFCGQYLLYVE